MVQKSHFGLQTSLPVPPHRVKYPSKLFIKSSLTRHRLSPMFSPHIPCTSCGKPVRKDRRFWRSGSHRLVTVILPSLQPVASKKPTPTSGATGVRRLDAALEQYALSVVTRVTSGVRTPE